MMGFNSQSNRISKFKLLETFVSFFFIIFLKDYRTFKSVTSSQPWGVYVNK